MTLYESIFEDFTKGYIDSFYKVMYPELLVYVTKILGESFSFLAEDCVQDAVMTAWHSRDRFSSPMQWRVFLYTCIRNEAISILRKGHTHEHYMDSKDNKTNAGTDIMLDLIEQETLTLLYNAVEELPEIYREIFDMSFEQGLKNAEVAALLNVAEVTVKKRKARLMFLLRGQLKGKIDETFILLLLAALASEF